MLSPVVSLAETGTVKVDPISWLPEGAVVTIGGVKKILCCHALIFALAGLRIPADRIIAASAIIETIAAAADRAFFTLMTDPFVCDEIFC